MNNKIEEYINNLFLRSPMSTHTKYAKQKLLTNAFKIYNDLLKSNLNENEAYEKPISHINDTYDIINLYSQANDENSDVRKKSAVITAFSVMLYILCPVPIIILESMGSSMEIVGLVMLFFMVGIATALLIYNSMSKPKNLYYDSYNTFSDSQGEYSKYCDLRKSISSIVWALIVALYFFISFTCMNWAYSWIIFLIGAAIEQIIKAYFDYKEEKEYEKKI